MCYRCRTVITSPYLGRNWVPAQIRCDDWPATIIHVPVAAVLVLNTPDDGRLRPKHVERLCRNKTCTALHQVGVSFDLFTTMSKFVRILYKRSPFVPVALSTLKWMYLWIRWNLILGTVCGNIGAWRVVLIYQYNSNFGFRTATVTKIKPRNLLFLFR